MPVGARSLLAAAAVCGAFAATRVAASFECDSVWPGPSANNEWSTCLGNVTHMKELYLDRSEGRDRAIGGGVIPFIIVIVAFFLYPVVLIGRYVCNLCGSNRRRPGTICCGGSEWDTKSEAEKQAAYDPKCRLCTRATPMLVALLAVIPFALMLAGGVRVLATYNDSFDSFHGTVGYFRSRVADARVELTATASNTTANNSVLSVIDSYFADADTGFTDADKTLSNYHDDYDHIAKAVGIVGIVISLVPLPFFITVILMALFNVRRCLPCAWTAIHWVLLVLYGIFAVAALVVAGVAWDACDEVTLGSTGAPGILSWYVAPLLDDSLPFKSIVTAVDAVEAEYAYKACDGLKAACDANLVYDPSGAPDAFLYCPTLTDARAQCTTIDNATAMLTTVTVKATAPVYCTSGATCTAQECASTCSATVPSPSTDAAADELRHELTDLLDLLTAANAAAGVWNATLKPMLSGDWIVQTVAGRLDTCDSARSGLLMLGVGATFFAALSATTIIILFLGQKRWFSPLQDDKEKDVVNPF